MMPIPAKMQLSRVRSCSPGSCNYTPESHATRESSRRSRGGGLGQNCFLRNGRRCRASAALRARRDFSPVEPIIRGGEASRASSKVSKGARAADNWRRGLRLPSSSRGRTRHPGRWRSARRVESRADTLGVGRFVIAAALVEPRHAARIIAPFLAAVAPCEIRWSCLLARRHLLCRKYAADICRNMLRIRKQCHALFLIGVRKNVKTSNGREKVNNFWTILFGHIYECFSLTCICRYHSPLHLINYFYNGKIS